MEKLILSFAFILGAQFVFAEEALKVFEPPKKAKSKQAIAADLMATSQPSDWRTVDPKNTLFLDLPAGRVIIELSPNFAPIHVAHVKALAHSHYWDGLAVVRVQDNYVVQWADPNSEKPDLKRKIPVALDTSVSELDVGLNPKVPFQILPDKDIYASEVGFSDGFASGRNKKEKKMWLLHCYGAVGVGRDTPENSGDGTELYAVIGHAPRHLDRNVTVIGRVIQGMEYFSSLPRGHGNIGFYEKPQQDVPIKSLKLESDLPENEQVPLEVLKTDTPLFKKLLEARRNRAEEWFHYQVGKIDACNMPIAVRKKEPARTTEL